MTTLNPGKAHKVIDEISILITNTIPQVKDLAMMGLDTEKIECDLSQALKRLWDIRYFLIQGNHTRTL